MLASFLTFHFVSRPSSAGCHTIFSFLLFYAFISLEYSFFTKIFLHTLRIICAFSLRRWISVVLFAFFRPFSYTLKKGPESVSNHRKFKNFYSCKISSFLVCWIKCSCPCPDDVMLLFVVGVFSCFRSLTLYTYTSSHLRMLNLTGSFFSIAPQNNQKLCCWREENKRSKKYDPSQCR